MKNYYEVLGLTEKATHDEIKSAYRKLAKKWHPDVNADKAAAEEKFKEIQEAYSNVGEEDKRASYDAKRSGRGGFPGFTGFGGFHTGFEDFFGMGHRRAPRKGRDMRCQMDLTLEEVVFGCTKTLKFRRSKDCDECLGLGGTLDSCVACNGTGSVTRTTNAAGMTMQYTNSCNVCGGRGSKMKEACMGCRGSGKTEFEETITVSVPATSGQGDVIKLAGKGESGPGSPGDLLVILNVKPHSRFRREMNHLVAVATIPFKTALAGGSFGIMGLKGEVHELRVPRACPHGHVSIIPGVGVAGGDMRVTVEYALPSLSDEALEKITSLL